MRVRNKNPKIVLQKINDHLATFKKFNNFFVYYPIWTFLVLKQVKNSLKKVSSRSKVYSSFYVTPRTKPYRAKCAKTVIAYKIKALHFALYGFCTRCCIKTAVQAEFLAKFSPVWVSETSKSNNKLKSFGILQVAKVVINFLQFFSDFYFLPSMEHFKLGTSLQLKY